TLMLNQERIPFNVAGKEISASMSYVPSEKAYDGHLDLAPLQIVYRNAAPIEAEVHGNFLLRAKEAEIKSLQLATRDSKLEATGTLRNYNNPELALEYQAALDLREVAREGKVAQLRGGRADLKGVLNYQNKRYSSQGTLNVRDMEWRDSRIRLTGIDASSPYAVTPEKLVLSRLVARLLGGNAQGSVEIANWSSPAAARKGAQPRGSAKAHLSGVELSRIGAASSTSRLPLEKVALAGRVSGDISSAWNGSPERAVSDLKLDVNPPANPTAREVPVTAQLQAVYHGDIRTLDVAGLSLATRAIRVNATGELGSDKAQARVSLNATDLRELQPALDAL